VTEFTTVETRPAAVRVTRRGSDRTNLGGLVSCAFAEALVAELHARGGIADEEAIVRAFAPYAHAGYVEELLAAATCDGLVSRLERDEGATVVLGEAGRELAASLCTDEVRLSTGEYRGDYPVVIGYEDRRPKTPAVMFSEHHDQQQPSGNAEQSGEEFRHEARKGRILSALRSAPDGGLPAAQIARRLFPFLSEAAGTDRYVPDDRRGRARQAVRAAISALLREGKISCHRTGDGALLIVLSHREAGRSTDARSPSAPSTDREAAQEILRLLAGGDAPEWYVTFRFSGCFGGALDKLVRTGYVRRRTTPGGVTHLSLIPDGKREEAAAAERERHKREFVLRARQALSTLRREGGVLTEREFRRTLSARLSSEECRSVLDVLVRKGKVRRTRRNGEAVLIHEDGPPRWVLAAHREVEIAAARKAFERFDDETVAEEKGWPETIPLEALGESI
jgi:DNA-binding MarR family transcriptional regulator